MHSGGLGYIGKPKAKMHGPGRAMLRIALWESAAPVNILNSSGPALSPENSGLHHETSGTPSRECVEARDPAQDLAEMIGHGAHGAQAALSSPVL